MASDNFVVLGASGGIGSETCRRLRSLGSNLLLLGRNQEELRLLRDELDARFRVVDATSLDEVTEAILAESHHLGAINGIVNCVGSTLLKPAHLTSAGEWHDILTTNLTSAFNTIRVGYQVMKRNGGAIVLLSSAVAELGLANHEAIAAAKAGVQGLMRSAAASYARRRIRVNAVAPGLVQTRLSEPVWSNSKQLLASQSMHAMGRVGQPQDVASIITWLLASENDWVTGQVFGIDGGLTTLRVPQKRTSSGGGSRQGG